MRWNFDNCSVYYTDVVGDIVELCTPCEVSGHERYAIVRSPVFLGDDSVKLGHSKDLGIAISRFLIPNAVE